VAWTKTSTKSWINALTWFRVSRYGEMAETMTATSLRVSRFETNPIRKMLVSRSSLENPRPFERFVRTTSPSSISTFMSRFLSSW
jgi:hypothetical protein